MCVCVREGVIVSGVCSYEVDMQSRYSTDDSYRSIEIGALNDNH